ncbi:MFS transporter [Neobacillus citreus]|uniref:Glycoside-pentoside-hexuronide (GPH):cation symporter n=1 Tax=Neobacillus citreus TaxID=2833578 RepID=A0A942Y6D7_9BACI|nr:glycoside-pentoside-hexuronide (GPH):cation symporter [Neobacillus citreus]MCH6264163.1 glycoside-pentoside-hexuronide (GPH):cation symporter [Neobacillus citreus]
MQNAQKIQVSNDGGAPYELQKPSKMEIFGYGLGDFGYILLWTIVGSFLSFYYTDVAGISAGVVGTIMLFARIWDGVTDIAMGVVVDKTKSKHGKARPYLLWIPIPLALSTIFLFTVPDFGMNGKIVYALITYSLFILMYTMLTIPFKTLLGLITQDQYSRSLIGVVGALFIQFSALVVNVSTQPLASSIGGQKGWTISVTLFSILSVIMLFFTFRLTKERVGDTGTFNKQKKAPFSITMKALLKNKYWRLVTAFCIIYYILLGLGGSELYYASYVLGSPSYFSIISMVKTIPGLIILFLISPFIKRFGKRNTAILGAAFVVLSALIKFIDPYSLTFFLTGSMFYGIAKGLFSATVYAMINDTAEYGEWKSGIRTTGLVNSSASFGMKIGTGVGAAMVGWLLAFGGYVGKAAEQSASALQMIFVLNIHLPLIIGVFLLIILSMYKLDKLYPEIIADLQKRT